MIMVTLCSWGALYLVFVRCFPLRQLLDCDSDTKLSTVWSSEVGTEAQRGKGTFSHRWGEKESDINSGVLIFKFQIQIFFFFFAKPCYTNVFHNE